MSTWRNTQIPIIFFNDEKSHQLDRNEKKIELIQWFSKQKAIALTFNLTMNIKLQSYIFVMEILNRLPYCYVIKLKGKPVCSVIADEFTLKYKTNV